METKTPPPPSSSSTMMRHVVSNGLWQGDIPLHFALPLLIIQITIVLLVTRSLGYVFKKMKQPRVLAEIIGGVLLGPTALGRNKAYMAAIFPPESIPLLETMALVGLMFYIFMVGLELDLDAVTGRPGQRAATIGLAGIAAPFLLSAAVAPVVNKTINAGSIAPPPRLGSLIVFVGTPLSISAFSVLVRMMAELGLLCTEVGEVAVPCAAVNDVSVWTLLAVGVAMAGPRNQPLIPVWVLVCGAAFAAAMLTLGRRFMGAMARRAVLVAAAAADHHNNVYVCGTLVSVLVAGMIGDAIGLHPLLGPFLLGLATPKSPPPPDVAACCHNIYPPPNFAKMMVDKTEDFVTGLMLPLFFASSGLKTDLASMRGLSSLAFLSLFMAVAAIGKIAATFSAARICGLPHRTALVLGFLMNTKGLAALIVLNVGRDLKVLSDQTFAILILTCLFTSFMTFPVVSILRARGLEPAAVCTTPSVVEAGTAGATTYAQDGTAGSAVAASASHISRRKSGAASSINEGEYSPAIGRAHVEQQQLRVLALLPTCSGSERRFGVGCSCDRESVGMLEQEQAQLQAALMNVVEACRGISSANTCTAMGMQYESAVAPAMIYLLHDQSSTQQQETTRVLSDVERGPADFQFSQEIRSCCCSSADTPQNTAKIAIDSASCGCCRGFVTDTLRRLPINRQVPSLSSFHGCCCRSLKPMAAQPLQLQSITIPDLDHAHQRVLAVADQKKANLIIRPWLINPALDTSSVLQQLLRVTNSYRHLLGHSQQSPCSIALLFVDGTSGKRRCCSTSTGSMRWTTCGVSYRVVVLFVGGSDDSEALCIASRMVYRRGVSVRIVRLMIAAAGANDDDGVCKQRALDEEALWELRQKAEGMKRVVEYEEEKVERDGVWGVMERKGVMGGVDLVVMGRAGAAAGASSHTHVSGNGGHLDLHLVDHLLRRAWWQEGSSKEEEDIVSNNNNNAANASIILRRTKGTSVLVVMHVRPPTTNSPKYQY